MTGYCDSVEVYIRVSRYGVNNFTYLLKEYGKRNLIFYQLGFDNLKTLDEILNFLCYNFHYDNGDLIIDGFCGQKFGIDEQMWRFVSSEIFSGHFILLCGSHTVSDLKFRQGKIIK